MSSLSGTARVLPILALFMPAASAWGGWAAFGEAGTGHAGLIWVNRPEALKTVAAGMSLDPGLKLPLVQSAAVVNGSPRFRIEDEGEFVLEVFVQLVARVDSDLLLQSGGKVLDDRLRAAPLRMYPGSRRRRTWALIGVVRGGQEFELRSSYPEFLLVAARWTSRAEFESSLAPSLAERIARMSADPFFENRNQNRAPRLRELGDLAMQSNQPAIRRHGLLGTARGTYWVAAENHEPRDIQLLAELLDKALAEMPQDRIVRQMASASCAGRNTGSSRGMPCTPAMQKVSGLRWEVSDKTDLTGAPAWAASQWQLRTRVEEITRYWVRERQKENGELAGGWGDDVEILRQWGPIAMGLGSAVAEKGIRRVALGVWSSGILKDGYNAGIEDVEHSAEPSSDTLPLLAAVAPSEADAREKLRIAAACADNWIAKQPDGMWRFKSSWYNCPKHDPAPERAVDVHLNARAMGPALWHAWLSRDAKLIELIERWGESWAAAMRATANGKPRGMIPAAMRSSDGKYLLGHSWDKPDVEWDYFQWSRGSQESIGWLFRALYGLTGKESWNQAAKEAFDAIGSRPPGFAPSKDEETLLTLLAAEQNRAQSALSVNFDMLTREAIYTDRVYYALPALVSLHLFGGDAPRGDRAPDFAVTWPPVSARFARVVMQASRERLEARLFSFDEGHTQAAVRLWRLQPGQYRWKAGARSGELKVEKLPVDLQVPLDGRGEVRLVIEPAAR